MTNASNTSCDDNNACTSKSFCFDGTCVPAVGSEKKCDDGNKCTDDSCDPKTGKCVATNNVAPCDSGDLCTYGDKCFNGACKGSSTKLCDDDNDCTSDSCDPKSGKCSFKSLKDGSPCTDGLACTTGDACQAGQCKFKSSKCPLFTETFECGDAGAGWTLDKPAGKKVIWAVDASPTLPNQINYACTLNFNNGTNYCDPAGNGCQSPTGTAKSPVIDGAKGFGTLRLTFETFYQVDGGWSDRPRVNIKDATTDAVITGFYLSKSSQNQNTWRTINVNISAALGKKFYIELFLDNPSGGGNNDGKGWAMDNIVIDQEPVVENCTDGVDNDGDGKADCEDPACISKGGCVELCGNGLDDDYDDKVDCDDPDCKGTLACVPATLEWNFNCGDAGWSYTKGANNVSWAIDATPAAVKPYTGGCTLNYNNGTNYCGVSTCSSFYNWSAGLATLDKEIDATQFKQLKASYWVYMDVSAYGNLGYDNSFLQVSTNNFKGCCGATNQCSTTEPENCNSAGNATFQTPEPQDGGKKWRQVEVDLSAFAGKKFKLRYRFNTVSSQSNNFPGVFVDDLRIYGTK